MFKKINSKYVTTRFLHQNILYVYTNNEITKFSEQISAKRVTNKEIKKPPPPPTPKKSTKESKMEMET